MKAHGEVGQEQPLTRWTEATFARLRQHADPEVDEMVAEYRRSHPELSDAGSLMRALIRELEQAKERARGYSPTDPKNGVLGILESLKFDTSPPAWGDDEQLIRRGQAVFGDYGIYQSVALFFACLPLAYAAAPGAKVLAGISDLATKNLKRRVAQTGQMLVDVMALRGTDSLKPDGPGHTTAVGLRIMHSFVRALILDPQSGQKWDSDRHGPPVNQELLLATLFDFSVVIWEAMERVGIELSDDDRAANLYTWSVFGHLMGVEACRDRPLTLADVEPVSIHMSSRLESSREGRLLMRVLLDEMEDFMFLGWRKLPRSLIHWLFRDADHGVDKVPLLLDVPKPAWWSKPMFVIVRAAHRYRWLPDPLRFVVRWLIRKAGRYVVLAYVDGYSEGSAPFRIPDDLARMWRIRRTPVAQRIRRIRHGTRRTVRASLRPLRHKAAERVT